MTELFNPHSNEWLINKFDYYKQLRSLDKSYYSEKYGLHVITRYADVIKALGDAETFSSAHGNLIVESKHRFGNTLGASDDPIHETYKNIVRNAYSKSNIERISNLYREKVREYISNRSMLDLSDIVDQTTGWATAEILNLPHDKEEIAKLVVGIQRRAMQCVQNNTDQTAYNRLNQIIVSSVDKNIDSPGPGIYHEFVNNNPRKIKVYSLFSGPTISGASSLTGAVQFLILDLYRERALSTVLNDRSLIPNAVQESLRFNSTTGRFSRTVSKPITLHGVNLVPGDRVGLCLESANRDETMFPNPDVFDLTRNTVGHLAFGHGIHACIALAISRNLMQVFLEEFLSIVGDYRVVTANKDLQYVMTASGNDDMVSNIVVEKI